MDHHYQELGMLSLKDMYNLGNGDRIKCNFDFSEISSDDYTFFYNTLPNFIYKKCSSITFNKKLFNKYEHSSQKNKELRRTISSSIASQKPKYSQYLMKILTKTIPRTKLLNTLCIDSIEIKESYMSLFFDAIPKSHVLKSLKIKNCHISDTNFISLITHLSPYHYEKLNFINCDLTDDSIPAICDFLKKKPKNSSKKCSLIAFDLSENDFSDKQVKKVIHYFNLLTHPDLTDDYKSNSSQDNLLESDNKKLSKSNFIEDEQEEEEEEEQEEEEEEQVEAKEIDDKQKRALMIRDDLLSSTHEILGQPYQEDDPYAENLALRKEFEALKTKLYAIQYDDDTFVLGSGASFFMSQVRELERLHPEVK